MSYHNSNNLNSSPSNSDNQSRVKKQSNGAMIAKLVFGVLFFVSIFEGQYGFGEAVLAIILSFGLIFWALYPIHKEKKEKEKQEVKEILAMPLKTYEEIELEKAIKRIEDVERNNSPQKEMQTEESPEMRELKKYRELVDQGLITEKDYEKKKRAILKL